MRRVLIPFLVGTVGACLVLLAIHLWSDHVAFHILLDFMNRHADQITKLP